LILPQEQYAIASMESNMLNVRKISKSRFDIIRLTLQSKNLGGDIHHSDFTGKMEA